VLQGVAVCCRVLQCVAGCYSFHWLPWITRDMTHPYVTRPCCMWRDSYKTILCVTILYVTWLIHMWHASYVWYDSAIRDKIRSCVTWLIHTRQDFSVGDMTHPNVTSLIYAWHDSSIRDATLLYLIQLIHTWQDSFMRDMTNPYVTRLFYGRHDSSICYKIILCVTWLIHSWQDSCICDTTHPYVTRLFHAWHDSSIRDTTLL